MKLFAAYYIECKNIRSIKCNTYIYIYIHSTLRSEKFTLRDQKWEDLNQGKVALILSSASSLQEIYRVYSSYTTIVSSIVDTFI